MIFGVHTILYSKKAEAVRAFFRDVLGFPCVDAGGGWLVFAAPPGELSIHPADTHVHREQLYLMCADVKAEVARLQAKGVEFSTPITDQEWGLVTQLKLPDGERLGLYQPAHPMAIGMRSGGRSAPKRAAAKKNPARKKRAGTTNARGRKGGRS
jgi:catechol 2,3-dioxygenase-like lactoylglutathione lyase family enzyme